MEEIIKKLREKLKESGMSYGDLAELTGIHRSILHRYLTGTTQKIPYDRLKAIASALEISLPEMDIDVDAAYREEVKDILIRQMKILHEASSSTYDVESLVNFSKAMNELAITFDLHYQ